MENAENTTPPQAAKAPGSALGNVPPVEVIRNEKGGYRFKHAIKNGERFVDEMGEECVVIGPGMAGMPEVQYEDGRTELAWPTQLTRLVPNGDEPKPKPTIAELEAMLSEPSKDSWEILPNGEIRSLPEGEGKPWKDLKPIAVGTIRDVSNY